MFHRPVQVSSSRQSPVTAIIGLLLVVLFTGLAGCVDCEKRFCRGVRVSSVQLMSVADRCCLEPELRGCEDPERFFQLMVEKLMLAYDACHENNYDRMLDILEELLRSLPFFALESVCDEGLAMDDSLRDWLDERCELIRNTGALFGPEDAVSVTAKLRFDQPGPLDSGQPTFHAFQPDSNASFETWFASGHSSLDGGLTLGRRRPLPGGGVIIPVHAAVFEFASSPGQVFHRVHSTRLMQLDQRVAGWIVLDERGVGRVGLQLCFEGRNDSVHGPVWFECPVSLVRETLRIESPKGSGALELFPVIDSIRDLFDIVESLPDSMSSSDDREFDPCERVDGASRRALAWLQRLRMVFPDCFTPSGAAG